jgi:hypothetical protein
VAARPAAQMQVPAVLRAVQMQEPAARLAVSARFVVCVGCGRL